MAKPRRSSAKKNASRAADGAAAKKDEASVRPDKKKQPSGAKRRSSTRRSAPDVIEKRRAARQFNDLVLDAGGGQIDGRTAKRRARLIEELRQGKVRASGRPLKPIDVLVRVQELLGLGETVASLKKVVKPARPLVASDELVDGLRALHAAYCFRLEAYAFVGIEDATLRAALPKKAKPGVIQKGLRKVTPEAASGRQHALAPRSRLGARTR